MVVGEPHRPPPHPQCLAPAPLPAIPPSEGDWAERGAYARVCRRSQTELPISSVSQQRPRGGPDTCVTNPTHTDYTPPRGPMEGGKMPPRGAPWKMGGLEPKMCLSRKMVEPMQPQAQKGCERKKRLRKPNHLQARCGPRGLPKARADPQRAGGLVWPTHKPATTLDHSPLDPSPGYTGITLYLSLSDASPLCLTSAAFAARAFRGPRAAACIAFLLAGCGWGVVVVTPHRPPPPKPKKKMPRSPRLNPKPPPPPT